MDAIANLLPDEAGNYPQKEKRTKKERTIDKRHMTYERVAQGSNPVKTVDKSTTDDVAVLKRRSKSLTSAEIDLYLDGLIMEGLIDDAFWRWHTRCVYTLGFNSYNAIVIKARDGKEKHKLLAFMLKGAMQLRAKQEFYNNPS